MRSEARSEHYENPKLTRRFAESKDAGRQSETVAERLTQLRAERESLQRSREQVRSSEERSDELGMQQLRS